MDKAVEELYVRRNMAILCKKIADQENRKDAVAEYNRQLENIDKKIEKLTGKPPDIVVGLQPGELYSEALSK